MKERFAFKEEFEPVVNIGENLQLIPKKKTGTGELYVKVLYVEALPYFERDFGALAAGVTAPIEFTQLYMEDGEVGQFRIIPVVDNLLITELAQPRAQRRWATKNASWTSLAEWADPRNNPLMEKYHLDEIFQYEDTGLWVTLTAAAILAASRIGCYGFRYVVEELKQKPTVFTPIPVEGFRSKISED